MHSFRETVMNERFAVDILLIRFNKVFEIKVRFLKAYLLTYSLLQKKRKTYQVI